MKKTLSVSAIKQGTVIDHIPAGKALTIVRLLHLAREGNQVTLGLNLPSRAMGQKDLIKVEHRDLTPEEAGRIAIIAQRATVNLIKNYTVTKKYTVTLPDIIERVLRCPNPMCITNHEPMITRFNVSIFKKDARIQCAYCEKIFTKDDIVDYRT